MVLCSELNLRAHPGKSGKEDRKQLSSACSLHQAEKVQVFAPERKRELQYGSKPGGVCDLKRVEHDYSIKAQKDGNKHKASNILA